MKIFVNGKRRVDERDIEYAEGRLKFGFPDDYRSALLNSNGGSFVHPLYESPISSIYLQTAYSLDELKRFNGKRLVVGFTGDGRDIELSREGNVFVGDVELGKDWEEVVSLCNRDEKVEELEDVTKLIQEGDLESLKELSKVPGFLERPNENGKTPAQVAAIFDQVEVLSWLISNKANLTGAIHLAAKYGGVDSVSLLHQSGVDLNELDASGQTPLDVLTPDCWGTRRYLKKNGAKHAVDL